MCLISTRATQSTFWRFFRSTSRDHDHYFSTWVDTLYAFFGSSNPGIPQAVDLLWLGELRPFSLASEAWARECSEKVSMEFGKRLCILWGGGVRSRD